MWVEELKNGKFKFVERYTDHVTGKIRRVSVTMDKNTTQSRKAAQRALQDKIEACIEEQYSKKDKMTFKDLVELYRNEQKMTVKPSTYSRNYHVCNSLMKILGENTLLESLSAGYIRSKFLATEKSAATLNEKMVRLKALLRWGYKNDFIQDISYLDKLDRFKDTPHRVKIENKFLESEELEKLISGMEIQKWRILTEFLAMSGLRFGEAAALTTDDIDLKERVIHVNKTYDSNNNIVTSTKTEKSTRDVYMQNQLYDICRKIKTERLKQQLISQKEKTLFPGSKKDHIDFMCYSKYLRKSSERILGRKITPHTLRHTHASLLMEKGVDIDTISRRLGHSDSRITKEIYLHVTEKLKQKENEKLKEIKIM